MLLADVSRFEKKLAELKKTLSAVDAAALEKTFAEARAARDKWLNSSS